MQANMLTVFVRPRSSKLAFLQLNAKGRGRMDPQEKDYRGLREVERLMEGTSAGGARLPR